jgi:transposase
VMAIAIRAGEQTRQVQMVCLDELVADDDVLRRVERLVAWGAVRESAAPFYSDFGRPGVDPVVLVKVFLVAAIRGFGSMRETLRVAEVDLSIRRFLGYGLTEARCRITRRSVTRNACALPIRRCLSSCSRRFSRAVATRACLTGRG